MKEEFPKMTLSRVDIPKLVRMAGFCGLILAHMLAVPALPGANATELRASYSNLDVPGFQKYADAFASDLGNLDELIQILKATEVPADRAARHRETIAIAEMLDEGRRQFEELYRKQAEEMADEVERARKDAEIRRLAAMLRLGASVLRLGAEFSLQSSPAPAGGDTGVGTALGLPGGDLSPNATEGSVSVEQRAEQKIRIFTDGQWRTIDVRQMIRGKTVSPEGGGPAPDPAPGATGDFADDSLADRFGAWAGDLPPIVCDDTFGGCFPMMPDSTFDSGNGPGPIEVRPDVIAPVAPPQRSPTGAEAALFKTISSMALDLTPIAGTAKSAAEVITGRDPVTGLELSRAAAAVGFVASAVPGGKLWVKVGGKRALKYAKKWYRHYTSRRGSNGILEKGVIKANPKKIYAERAGGRNKNPLSKADAEGRHLIRDGKGRDYVEFQVPEGTEVKIETGLGGFEEIVIEGDVILGPGARVMQRTQRR